MTVSSDLRLLGLAILWVGALATPRTRTWPYLAFLAIVSLVTAGATTFGGHLGGWIASGVVALALLVWIWPTRLGLASFSRADIEADKAFRRLEQELDRPDGARRAPDLIPTLDRWTLGTPRDAWAIAARLYRHHLVRLAGLTAIDRPKEPAIAFRNAGHDYWVIASWRRVIGRRRVPAVWDEDVVLHCFAADVEDLIPRAAVRGDPVDPATVRTTEAARLIDDLRACPLVHPIAIEVRELLAIALTADLELATGDHSPEAIDRQREATAALDARWRELAAVGAKIVGSSSPPTPT